MKKHLLILILSIISNQLHAQIGINTDTPDTSAVLDISTGAHKGGLLIPRLDEAQRNNIYQPKKSLLLFETTSESFLWHVSGDEWSVLNTWRQKVGATQIVDTVVSDNVAQAKEFVGHGTIPYGGIIMWSGDPLNLPDGWQLCDGSGYTDKYGDPQNTPDLRGRFIVGYDGGNIEYDAIAITGGKKEVILDKSNLPKHFHEAYGDGATINIKSSGRHNHNLPQFASEKFAGRDVDGSFAEINNQTSHSTANAEHRHFNSDFAGKVGDGTTDGLDNQPHENRPPYYVLAFIMRVK